MEHDLDELPLPVKKSLDDLEKTLRIWSAEFKHAVKNVSPDLFYAFIRYFVPEDVNT